MRRALALVVALNLGYFVIEFGVALAIESVALMADSVDFIEDAAVGLLVLLALRMRARHRAAIGRLLAVILLLPAIAFFWTLWKKYLDPVAPLGALLGLTALGALAVNFTCALILARHRDAGGSLTKAAFLSARNDAIANIAIILAALVTVFRPSIWPDVFVGICIAAINATAAKEVWEAAREESPRPLA